MSRPLRAAIFGASGGVGAAITRALCEGGHEVFAGARDPAKVPPQATAYAFDLNDEASIAQAFAQIGGTLDLIFVASGVLHDPARAIAPEKSWRAIDPAAMAAVFAANTIGPALIAKHGLPLLPRDRRGVFAALSARVGSIGDNRLGGWHAYRASKAALNMLITNFAIELARVRPQAIAVALHPGTVATDLSAPFRGAVAPDRLFTPEQSADHLLHVVAELEVGDSGGCFAWDGSRIPA